MQNAYSRQASVEVEQQLGTAQHGQRRLPVHARPEPDHLGEPERADVRGRRHQQRLPAESDLREQQPVFAGRPTPTITACTCRSCSGRRGGATTASATRYSKSMNNVGENFFSSPIDPFDLSKDWGRSDDDQRHRLVLTGSVNSSMEPAQTAWERISHGFQVSSMLQSYSALPFNITSGVTTVQGTAGRPIVNGAFIERNAGVGSDFFSLSLRVSRTFPLGKSVRRGRAARGVQPDQSRQQPDAATRTSAPAPTRRTRRRPSIRSRRSAIRERFSSASGSGSDRTDFTPWPFWSRVF